MQRSTFNSKPLRLALVLMVPILLPESFVLTTFAQTATPIAEATAVGRLDSGIYRVYATREGLVGGWTTSNHEIVENDFFVALPACTPSNCPEGAPRGTMTDCGDKCYVKVTNPENHKCRVEPIKDTGPWFTVDDWWNPEKTRYLNTLPSTSPKLPQGLPAAEAALDGQDVGYGVNRSGIGFDNTHEIYDRPQREVGNRAAIDLADGTWWNLELVAEDTIGTHVVVHMLWQTGEDPYAAALSCGHKLNTPGDVPSRASPVASPVAATPGT
jgi:hypothetical protein